MYSPQSLSIKNIISYQDSRYEFNNNSATIIVGNNLDNPSQKVNGAGKSGLIESLALAFTGSSIRDVKGKELVRRGEKSGEVELILTNSQTKKDLKIWRRIYSGTKSGECRVWLGEDEVRLADINSYNKFIFETIGLSKDDFFNFYLLTQANYSPFLRVGDTKKKEIINRFSGANIIDNVFDIIKQDSVKTEGDVMSKKSSISELEISINLLNNQLKEFEEKEENIDLERQEKINVCNQEKQRLNQSIVQVQEEIVQKKEQLKELEKTVQEKQYDKQIQEIEDEIKELEEQEKSIQLKIKEVEKSNQFIKDLYQDDYNTLKEQLAEVDELKADLNCNHKSLLLTQSKHQKSLLGSLECPHCHNHFVVKSELSYEELVKEKEKIDKDIIEIENCQKETESIESELIGDRKRLDKEIEEKQKEGREQISQLYDQLEKLKSEKNQLKDHSYLIEKERRESRMQIEDYERKINTKQSSIDQIQKDIDREDSEIQRIKSFSYQEVIKDNKAKIKEKKALLEKEKKDLDLLNEEHQKVVEWETSFKNFKSFVANQSIKNIEDYTNIFLQQMGSDLGIILDGYSTLTSGKIKEQISVEVTRRGFEEGSYGSFSGGERGRIDICVILAIQQLINLNCKGGGLDLLICDEILDQIDVVGLESIIHSLQDLNRTIMIVSQNEINSLKEHTLMIEKKNKISNFAF